MIFKCKHPAKYLGVEAPCTAVKMDEDFDHVTIHLYCIKCREKIDIKYTTFAKGVEDFMAPLTRMYSND